MDKLTFKELAIKILEEEKRPLTVEEIWELAKKKGYDKLCSSQGKTPWRTIGAQIYVDIRDNPLSPFVKIGSKPRKFFLKKLASETELKKIEEKEKGKIEGPKKLNYSERELHPFLTYFAYTYMGIYTKTIYHEKSSKRKYSQWLHPDIVGVYFPIEEWKSEVLDFAKEIGSSSIILYSFELKREIGFHNLRESFFQAVSNSSWANEGYLVAANIDKDEELMNELKRLSTAFGIGVIKLDIENPDSSEIIFPSKHKRDLDWDTINKLAEENPDFKGFLKRIKVDLSSKEIRKEKYDKLFEGEELIKRIKK
ncbi:COG2958 family protein [Thermosipho globiformans]|uniref:COG2958 family protein n=1 Tax=Thermosipho globiformans TaxID=380685 RepID=UPI000F8DD5FF|nr:HTH domain-containing protein [Thermosipho globiformans]